MRKALSPSRARRVYAGGRKMHPVNNVTLQRGGFRL